MLHGMTRPGSETQALQPPDKDKNVDFTWGVQIPMRDGSVSMWGGSYTGSDS